MSDPTATARQMDGATAFHAGIVDMIGSGLLFSSYGIGFKTKPFHAEFTAARRDLKRGLTEHRRFVDRPRRR